jgi:hypothetical protein
MLKSQRLRRDRPSPPQPDKANAAEEMARTATRILMVPASNRPTGCEGRRKDDGVSGRVQDDATVAKCDRQHVVIRP